MVIDTLEHASLYYSIHSRIKAAFDYLQQTDLASTQPGKYPIDGDNIFAIVQEYDTLDMAAEQMESHKKYFDVQYIVSGEEQVGHALLASQAISKPYSEADDFMLYADKPDFFTYFHAGMFMVFFPHDLHMPCLHPGKPARVKKVVVKVAV
jgi:YhcH/YjgK/YiaL family protein